MTRNSWAATVATIAVIAVIGLGLGVMGGPGKQRLVQSDLRTVRSLGELAQHIKFAWQSSGEKLPANLEKFPSSAKQNVVTAQPFTYRVKSQSEYELCATFATDSRNLHAQDANDFWAHPQGQYCFQLDAAQQVPQTPYYY